MISFLFWNLNRQPLELAVSRLAQLHDIDVVILAECKIEPVKLLLSLNQDGEAQYHYVPPLKCEKIELFVRFPSEFIKPVIETERLTVRNLDLPGLISILLVAVHFQSKLHWSDDSQAVECTNLSSLIKEEEQRIGHCRTILVGDLNMNPL